MVSKIDNECIVELIKDIGRLHKELSDKYEELSLYLYPNDDEDIITYDRNIDDDDDDDEIDEV
jgi:hypothetical protein